MKIVSVPPCESCRLIPAAGFRPQHWGTHNPSHPSGNNQQIMNRGAGITGLYPRIVIGLTALFLFFNTNGTLQTKSSSIPGASRASLDKPAELKTITGAPVVFAANWMK